MSVGLILGRENATLAPHTKRALVATVCMIMISDRVGGIMDVIHPVLALVPFALLLFLAVRKLPFLIISLIPTHMA